MFAFSAGMLAPINPCGWAILPAFLSFSLDSQGTDSAGKSFPRRLGEGALRGVLVTAGFLTMFGAGGVAVSAGLRFLIKWIPPATFALGLFFALLGVWLLAGKPWPWTLPVPNLNLRARNPRSVFLFGLAYGFASLSCTLPVFLAVVGASLTVDGLTSGAAMFSAYAAGVASVLMLVALSAALLQDAILQWFQRYMPYTYRFGAIMLILAGGYLLWFQGRYLPWIPSGLW